ncbi:hypothetical protein GpartN1_g6960.t1 [Galdieria partita]|uniref:Uncharacterized protein n=1 Tax=Galdieria partita TaxID=83374 RepID=A0A9C7Q3J6_9RHOD|nr:hypothetical protein GpartN1_g6960.t1 [Galdieria partita]
MSADTSKLWALGALSASLCLVTSIVAYCTWSRLKSKNTKKTASHKAANNKAKKKKKNRKSRASSTSHESINEDGNNANRQEEYSAEDSGWIPVRSRRRKLKAKD